MLLDKVCEIGGAKHGDGRTIDIESAIAVDENKQRINEWHPGLLFCEYGSKTLLDRYRVALGLFAQAVSLPLVDIPVVAVASHS